MSLTNCPPITADRYQVVSLPSSSTEWCNAGASTNLDHYKDWLRRTIEYLDSSFSKTITNIKEKETDENNNKKECVESHAETSTLRKGDKDEETAVSKVKEVVVEDVVCKSIRPKIILKAHCHRRS